MADGFDLTGPWQGVYSYPGERLAVPFSARLAERDAWLTGSTEETATHGAARGTRIAATLQGRRDARVVTFLKLYDSAHDVYDSVQYQGTLSADGSEIAGRWSIPGGWAGSFLMIRGSANSVAEKQAAAKV